MNLRFRFLAVGALLTASLGFAADVFEGKVSLALTAEKGRSMNMDYSLKGQKVRMDMNAEGHQVAMITDFTKMESLVLMPEQNMYMTLPIKKAMDQAMNKKGE